MSLMSLGNNLFQARKKRGLSQEEVAEKLGVSRQTISKWETDETLPDIQQSKQLALLYRLSLDELIDFDMDVAEVHQAIERTSTALEEKIDWTKAWGKKYPILLTYRQQVEVEGYAAGLEELLEKLKQEYGYSELDAFLILKDILAAVWKQRKQQGKR
jgi:transcriptional regulator with XRE-family HTH domain